MSTHAVLSPSSAGRWLACTPSARLEQQFPDHSGEAALEGVLAHALAELMLSSRNSEQPELHSDEPSHVNSLETKRNDILHGEFHVTRKNIAMTHEIAAIKQHARYSEDMLYHVESYVTFVENQLLEARETTSDAVLLIEQLLDLRSWVPDGFGTADAVIIADGLMEIIDLKFGKGVPVSATGNKQMMLYALGAIHKFGIVYDIHSVRMTIFQPRLDNVSTFEMSADALEHWADTSLAPLARLAFAGEGDFIPGDHCRFCKARAQCKAFADQNLVLAKHDFKDQTLLSDNQISSILLLADQFKRWLSDLEEFALSAAVSSGKQWPGLKLVEGRSIRQYSSQDEVARTLIHAGIPEAIIYERKLLGLTAMEKALSKKTFNELLSGLIIKPQGKPALVPLNDKRSELNSASKDFSSEP